MKNSVFRRSLAGLSRVRSSALTGGVVLASAALSQGCLQRDVVKQQPNTSNVFVDQLINDSIDEIDLLFVIDNSVSMADKQAILKLAVPQMVERLINPQCVTESGAPPVPANPDGTCPADYGREFNPIEDIHIGVISSSLGGHGSGQCQRGAVDPDDGLALNYDDQGYLMPKVRPDAGLIDDPAGSGFLTWLGNGQSGDELVANFAAHVEAAGERGCGFEATLESWYRFLVDPQPPVDIVVDGEGRADMLRDESGAPMIDGNLLEQREQFLRPQGLVAIVVLSDENDCSVMDGGDYYNNASYGYLVADVGRPMPIATAECDANPNAACCFSCLQAGNPPSGCDASACGDPTAAPPVLPAEQDRGNVRCFQNKRRFGVDLLYPTQRYVDALSRGQIINARDGTPADNPLLRGAGENAGKNRAPGLVFFAGIVGLPWQDVATEDSLADPAIMAYLTADELLAGDPEIGANRWQVILGQPNLPMSAKECDGANPDSRCGLVPEAPLDPFMIESISPRDTNLSNPISGDFIMTDQSNDPRANDINGHEANHNYTGLTSDGKEANDDLQYACIFPLSADAIKNDCPPDDYTCDCSDEPSRNRPLCQPDGGGAAGTTQYWGKAYPGTRILQVLRDFGHNSIVGSICPKITEGDVKDVNFGYNPAVQAIVDRLKEKLGGKCLPREVSTSPDGSVPCTVVEALYGGDGATLNCGADGRAEVEQAIRPAVIKQLKELGNCDGTSNKACSAYVMCEIKELLEQPGRDDCLYTPLGGEESLSNAGFCYIDPAKVVENEDGTKSYPAGGEPPNGEPGKNPVVDGCPATERRLLRFVGQEKTPASDTITFVACSGDAASADAQIPAPPEEKIVASGGTDGD